MGDFRDSLVAGLLQAPPFDESECAAIKQVLAADLERRCQWYATDVMNSAGEGNSLVARLKHTLAALQSRPLTQDDMRDYACLEIKKRIRQMLDADVASGRLVVHVIDGKQVVLLDDFAAWAAPKKITPDQPSLPGCTHSLVDASYQRLHQKLSGVASIAEVAGTESPSGVPPVLREQENKILEWLRANKYDPQNLPKIENGYKTAKSYARNALNGVGVFAGSTTFNKAWDRLRMGGEIKEVE